MLISFLSVVNIKKPCQYGVCVFYFVPGITNAYLYRLGILLTCEKHDCIISTREEIGAHKTSLTLSLLIEFLVHIQESEQSCNLCVKDIDFSFSTTL